MKFSLTKKQCFGYALAFSLFFSVFLSLARFSVACDGIRNNVLRLHIIANSDSDADQELKLKIRDEILNDSDELFQKSNNLSEAISFAKQNTERYEKIANDVIKKSGFNYSAKVTVGDSHFGTREYDDFTLPAGTYKSLIITLGEAKGHNWWCVIYPEVCVPTAVKGDLSDSVDGYGCKVAKQSQKYIMRFKAVEIYEEIKKYINR